MKNRFFRLTCLILCAITILPLAACGNTETADTTTEQTVQGIDFFASGSPYVMIRSEDAGEKEISAFTTLRKAIAAATGTELELNTDWLKKDTDPGEYEIVFGNTNRPETTEALSKIEGAGYIICVINNKLVFAATSTTALQDSVTAFTEFLNGEDKTITAEFLMSGIEETSITSVTINGIPLKDYTIVVESVKGWQLPVYTLKTFGTKYCGVTLQAVAASAAGDGHKIIIGGTKADGTEYERFETEVYYKDGDLHLGCKNTTMAQKAIYTFIGNYLSHNGALTVELPEDGTAQFNSTAPDDWTMADPGEFISIQDRICRSAYQIQAILEYDTSLGEPYTYHGSGYKQNIVDARSLHIHVTNCVILANWVMKQAGFYKSGIYNIKYDGTTGYTLGGSESTKFFTENFEFIDMRDRGASISTLQNSGEVWAGDIIIYQSHTMIVMPLGNSCDGGRGNTKEKAIDSEFVQWVGATLYPTMKVGYIIRSKDAVQ